jgi:molybdate transport system permease protein
LSRTRLPAPLLAAAAVGVAVAAVPLIALVIRAPWSRIAHQLASHDVLAALRISLESSVAALVVAAVLGVPLAWVLAQHDFPGRALLRAVVTLPMVLPPVVGGVALLSAFGRRGLVGSHLHWLPGFPYPFSLGAVVLAEAFVAMPFLVVTAEAGFSQVDRRYAEAAASLGARSWRRFWTVSVPLAAPSLVAGAALTWARAVGEFGATITFAGNLPGRTQTMPSAIYAALQTSPDGAITLSLVLLAAALAVLVALRGRWVGALH